jgi:carbonic anhydrase
MSCSAPIDIPTKTRVNSIAGTFNCIYDANMLASSAVSLSKDLSHLSIKCTSNNKSKVSFYNAGIYTPYEIRIYKPSLHTYNGVPADAELLIMHSSVSSNSSIGSDGLIVSVPVSVGGKKNAGLNAIIQSANTLNAGTAAINSSVPISSAVDANDFIPSKPFYVYNGTLPYDSCGGNYYYAVFTDPIFISTPINNLTPSGIKIAPPPALLQKSKTGPRNGIGSTANDDHVLIEIDNSCESDVTNAALNQSNVQNGNESESSINVINILWGILIIFFLWVIYWGISCAFFWSKNREGSGDVTSGMLTNVAKVDQV